VDRADELIIGYAEMNVHNRFGMDIKQK